MMSLLALPFRLLRALRRRVRWRLWTLRLRIRLRRHGVRLLLDAPHGADLEAPPRVELEPRGEGERTFTLRVGRGVRIGAGLRLELWAHGTNVLELGDGAQVLHGVRVQIRSGALRIGPESQVRELCVLKSSGELVMGRRAILGHGVLLHCEEELVLEDLVGLAERVSILDSDHVLDGSDRWFMDQPLRVAATRLERNTFVASNAVVLRGTRIGPNAVVGAGAVVAGGDYPGGWLIAGTPARAVKALSPAVAAADAG